VAGEGQHLRLGAVADPDVAGRVPAPTPGATARGLLARAAGSAGAPGARRASGSRSPTAGDGPAGRGPAARRIRRSPAARRRVVRARARGTPIAAAGRGQDARDERPGEERPRLAREEGARRSLVVIFQEVPFVAPVSSESVRRMSKRVE